LNITTASGGNVTSMWAGRPCSIGEVIGSQEVVGIELEVPAEDADVVLAQLAAS
jgi:hypothetical protein